MAVALIFAYRGGAMIDAGPILLIGVDTMLPLGAGPGAALGAAGVLPV
jgi:hypothetical protein